MSSTCFALHCDVVAFFSLFLFLLSCILFFFHDTATTEIYTLSLHDALPIYLLGAAAAGGAGLDEKRLEPRLAGREEVAERSEEHTSELQSHSDLVCRLLLEKKKQKRRETTTSQSKDKEPLL